MKFVLHTLTLMMWSIGAGCEIATTAMGGGMLLLAVLFSLMAVLSAFALLSSVYAATNQPR